MISPLIVDLEGTELTQDDKRRIRSVLCGGVILFSRNYRDRDQLIHLIEEIRSVKIDKLLVCVDQEGGRVQRFKHQFTALPEAARVGDIWDRNRDQAIEAANKIGVVLGAELKSVGVDLTFAPVLDLNQINQSVIGDRAFHSRSEVVVELARAFVTGLRDTGILGVGKHFPGHGGVAEDTHHDNATDVRDFEKISQFDLIPFAELSGELFGVMPSHVIYSSIDSRSACFSKYWLKDVLRKSIGFEGYVFSDDLSMNAARSIPNVVDRVSAALGAGCDYALVCNSPEELDLLLSEESLITQSMKARNETPEIQRPTPRVTMHDDQYDDALKVLKAYRLMS
jgi:beta-N-acetylhexosaminidase